MTAPQWTEPRPMPLVVAVQFALRGGKLVGCACEQAWQQRFWSCYVCTDLAIDVTRAVLATRRGEAPSP